MILRKMPHATEQVSPFTITTEAVLPEPGSCNYGSLQAFEPVLHAGKPLHWEACVPQPREQAPLTQLEKPMYHQRPSTAKIRKKVFFKGGWGWLCSNFKNLYFKEEKAGQTCRVWPSALAHQSSVWPAKLNTAFYLEFTNKGTDWKAEKQVWNNSRMQSCKL